MARARSSATRALRVGKPARCPDAELADIACALFHTMSSPAWIFNRQTLRVVEVNDAAVRHYGYSHDEFLALTVDKLRSPEEWERLRAEVQDESDGPEQRGRWRHTKKDGTVIPVEVTRHAVTWGGAPAWLVVAKDVTELMTSEDVIRRLTVAVDQSPAAVVVTDTKGRIEYVNRRFTEITGYTSAEVFGKTPRVLQSGITPPEIYKDLWTTITAGREWTGVMQNRRKDGQLYWDSATISPVRDTTGVVTHFVAIKQDVSAQRLLEDQFRQAQKMEAVGRRAGGVAHDFNNLLSVITSYSEMVLEDLGPADPRRADLDEIRKAAVAAAGLTRPLLPFSRQQVLQPRVLSPNAVIEGIDKMLRRLIGEDVALTMVLAPDIGSIKADPGQMEQVIMNLAVNARDAMPKGGQLTLAPSNIELDSHYAGDHIPVVPGSYVLLAVTDTGSGMDDETKRRLFEPFFTTKEKGKGTGLGLATVYGIVKQSGGFIWVYSELGQGTTFKIYVPRVAEEPAAAEAPRSPESLRGTETVLLAEDSPGVRSAARQILGRLGYTIVDAPNGAAALDLAANLTGPLDLLVTDVVMPEMSGRQLAERLTAVRPGLKVLYVSGYTDDAVVRHGVLEAGISYLEKPFTPERLARKVREVLDAGKGAAR